MQREPFYTIPEDAYLFRGKVPNCEIKTAPEEQIRQWCAHELIRAYGFRINEIEFERPVRVASKTLRIDILVSRGARPWAVIECKKRSASKNRKGIEQAISYANAEGIKALFAVYTNGDTWHVQRRVQDHWQPVLDLPQNDEEPLGEHLSDIMWSLDAVAPLLYSLDNLLTGTAAQKYLEAMQGFFNGRSLLLHATDGDLCSATDHLLRILAGGKLHSNYRLEKLGEACEKFRLFCEGAAITVTIPDPVGADSYDIQLLYASLINTIESPQGAKGLNYLLLRLNTALADYGQCDDVAKGIYNPLPNKLHAALRCFLDAAFIIALNTRLPDNLDVIRTADMKKYCGKLAGVADKGSSWLKL